jgi:hypothetical protein
MRVIALGLVIAFAACKGERFGTIDGEDGMMLVREYRPMGAGPDPKTPPTWVLRVDLGKVNAGSYNQHWSGDSLDLQVGTANGMVAGQLACSVKEDVLSCDGHDWDAKAGRVITYTVDATGRIGSPQQTDLAAYKSFH